MRKDPAGVVLVHGGSHGPWCWEPVVAGLENLGLDARTVELPLRTLGEDADVVRAGPYATPRLLGRWCWSVTATPAS